MNYGERQIYKVLQRVGNKGSTSAELRKELNAEIQMRSDDPSSAELVTMPQINAYLKKLEK